MSTIAALLLSLYFSFTLPSEPIQTKVVVKMTDIRSRSGCLRLGIYKDQDSFKNERPLLKKTVFKSSMNNGTVACDIMLEPGTYGIALLDDEDSDGDMDYGLILPDEGFGFSNYYHTGLSKPKLSNFTFTVNANQTANVTIRVKYM
jgi:uncharacterized protein (DUF2141 family)